MPRIERTAEVVWEGNVARGAGHITAGTGAFSALPYSLPTRIGAAEGKTSPEALPAVRPPAVPVLPCPAALARGGRGRRPERVRPRPRGAAEGGAAAIRSGLALQDRAQRLPLAPRRRRPAREARVPDRPGRARLGTRRVRRETGRAVRAARGARRDAEEPARRVPAPRMAGAELRRDRRGARHDGV